MGDWNPWAFVWVWIAGAVLIALALLPFILS
jgi:hypothetical protein